MGCKLETFSDALLLNVCGLQETHAL